MLKLVVYATHSDGYFNILINQAKKLNYTIEILGWQEKWLGFYKRTLDLYNFLKLQPNNDIILCIDGFDSMILEDKHTLLQKFYSFNSPIVWGIEHNDVIKPFIFKSNFNYTVNGGSFIGYNFHLKLIFEEIIKKFGTKNYKQDDQKIINWMNNNDKLFQELVKLDVDSHLFANITYDSFFYALLNYFNISIDKNYYSHIIQDKHIVNKYNFNKPSIISGPGNVNISHLVKFVTKDENTCKRKGYQMFLINNFKFELLFFIIILILLFCIIKFIRKRKAP